MEGNVYFPYLSIILSILRLCYLLFVYSYSVVPHICFDLCLCYFVTLLWSISYIFNALFPVVTVILFKLESTLQMLVIC